MSSSSSSRSIVVAVVLGVTVSLIIDKFNICDKKKTFIIS